MSGDTICPQTKYEISSWTCMNQLLSAQLMHFGALSSLCSNFLPSFMLPPDAPLFVGKQTGKREKQAHTHTHTLIQIGGQVWLHLEDNQRKYMDTHHTSWQHRDIHQVLSLYSVFQKERLKYQVDHTWWYGDMTIICNLVPLRISRFMDNLWLSRWGVGGHTMWNKASLLQSEDKWHLS